MFKLLLLVNGEKRRRVRKTVKQENGKNGEVGMGVKKEQNAPDSLEGITEQLEALEGDLVNPLNDPYTHLQILLKIVKLQYDKIRLLDIEITRKR